VRAERRLVRSRTHSSVQARARTSGQESRHSASQVTLGKSALCGRAASPVTSSSLFVRSGVEVDEADMASHPGPLLIPSSDVRGRAERLRRWVASLHVGAGGRRIALTPCSHQVRSSHTQEPR